MAIQKVHQRTLPGGWLARDPIQITGFGYGKPLSKWVALIEFGLSASFIEDPTVTKLGLLMHTLVKAGNPKSK